jgi:hypothetical protein
LLGNNSGAIGLSGANFGTGLHSGVAGSPAAGSSGNPANRGTGLNLFADPAAVFNSVRRVLLSQDTRSGRNALRGLGFWQADLSISKETRINERLRFIISADFINAFNHVNFNDPGISLQNPAGFGVISSQRIDTNADGANGGFTPRVIQIGARFQF